MLLERIMSAIHIMLKFYLNNRLFDLFYSVVIKLWKLTFYVLVNFII